MKKTNEKKENKRIDTGPLGSHSVGDVVVIRAIPYHYIGRIELLGLHGVTLSAGAVWLADSGRWGSSFLLEGTVSESEPYPDRAFIRYEVIADVTKWRHPIPGQV